MTLIIRIGLMLMTIALLVWATPVMAAVQQHQPPPVTKLLIKVVDETGVAVAGARIVLEQSATQTLIRGETDAAGRHEFDVTNVGPGQLKIEKEGFYASTTDV